MRDLFLLRSRVVASIRRRLDAAGFVEVETPVLHPVAGGATARPFVTHYNALHADMYLRIATELFLKRCVVGGLERVYELGRVFRNEGLSPRHNPEFTMLELYQAYADYTDMMAIFENLVSGTAEELFGTTVLSYQGRELDLTPPWRRATLTELIAEHAGVEVELSMGVENLQRFRGPSRGALRALVRAGQAHVGDLREDDRVRAVGPVFVCDYPQEVSPLARSHRSKPGYVERFEPIVAGRELGNAFSELNDPDEQRARFEDQERERALGDDEAMAIDWDYLRALELGLPPTGGLGLGIDRLVMLYADVPNIREVVLFPALRPEERSGDPRFDRRACRRELRPPCSAGEDLCRRALEIVHDVVGELHERLGYETVTEARAACAAVVAYSRAMSCAAAIPGEAATSALASSPLALVERVAQHIAQPRADGGVRERPLHGKGVDALGQVLAGRLAQLGLGGDDVENVVADLKDHAEGLPEGRQVVDLGPVSPAVSPPILHAVDMRAAVLSEMPCR